MTALLQFNNICVHGAKDYRLENINLSINVGEKVALLGQSGAGKSTLISIANGTIQPYVGQVQWHGIEVNQLNQSQRREIATLWQDLRLIEELNVAQNINTGALAQKNLLWAFGNLLGVIEQEECITCLKAAGLNEGLLQTSVQELSGGQRQRVAIARLLRQEAEIMLADEPLSSLDPALVNETVQLLIGKKSCYLINIPEMLIML